MRILLVNDDGIEADGIWALYDFLAGEHDVTVCAPDRQCSGFSHSITIAQRLRVRRHERGDREVLFHFHCSFLFQIRLSM